MANETTLRIIAFSEFDQWVAQCLEHDVCVQAPDLDTLRDRMEAAFYAEDTAQREAGKDGLSAIPAAPEHFFSYVGKTLGI